MSAHADEVGEVLGAFLAIDPFLPALARRPCVDEGDGAGAVRVPLHHPHSHLRPRVGAGIETDRPPNGHKSRGAERCKPWGREAAGGGAEGRGGEGCGAEGAEGRRESRNEEKGVRRREGHRGVKIDGEKRG